MEVKQSNPNWAKELDLKLKELDGHQTKVGWFEGNVYPESGTPVAYVAQIQEMGYKAIPPRPFMRPTVDKQSTPWRDLAGMLAKRVLDGKMTGRDAMDGLGLQAESDIAGAIVATNSPPLSKITLAARYIKDKGGKVTGATIGEIARRLDAGENVPLSGRTKPLQDSKRMLDTITHVTESTS